MVGDYTTLPPAAATPPPPPPSTVPLAAASSPVSPTRPDAFDLMVGQAPLRAATLCECSVLTIREKLRYKYYLNSYTYIYRVCKLYLHRL